MLSITVLRLGRLDGVEGRAAAAAAGAEENRMPICNVAVLSREVSIASGTGGASKEGAGSVAAVAALLLVVAEISGAELFSGE
jgi:hypothetical protein